MFAITRYNCSFTFYMNDRKLADVKIDNGTVHTVRHSNKWWELPFGDFDDWRIRKKLVDAFYERHSCPRHKANLDKQLAFVGLTKWDAFELCRRTDGRVSGYPYWIKWDDKEYPEGFPNNCGDQESRFV
ncbi:MAG: hypothetical protein LBT59_29370 [Clostridiales bacterium]|jgi:hypothetical protein|nr:hypothetical protein [Clostridiales bacterium]